MPYSGAGHVRHALHRNVYTQTGGDGAFVYANNSGGWLEPEERNKTQEKIKIQQFSSRTATELTGNIGIEDSQNRKIAF